MPKRSYPYEEDLLPQLKVHVGQKEVNNGVNKEQCMKHVYDKTLNLLKEGVKTLSNTQDDIDQLNVTEISTIKVPLPEVKSERSLKQMVLNNKLKLEKGNKVLEDTEIDVCGSCQVMDQKISNKCYYCDQIVCSSCLSCCVKCTEKFCPNCTLPTYNSEEYNVCLNCYHY